MIIGICTSTLRHVVIINSVEWKSEQMAYRSSSSVEAAADVEMCPVQYHMCNISKSDQSPDCDPVEPQWNPCSIAAWNQSCTDLDVDSCALNSSMQHTFRADVYLAMLFREKESQEEILTVWHWCSKRLYLNMSTLFKPCVLKRYKYTYE